MAKKNFLKFIAKWPGGGIGDLANAASRVLQDMGQPDDTLGPENELRKRIRVIRSYMERGILSPSTKDGKESVYRAQHLSELVAARVLARQGVSLQGIGQAFRRDPDLAQRTLGMPAPADSAQAVWEELAQRDGVPPNLAARRVRADSMTESLRTYFRSKGHASGHRNKTRIVLEELGVDTQFPRTRRKTRIEVAPWCAVDIDTEKLAELAPGDLDKVAFAIAEALKRARTQT